MINKLLPVITASLLPVTALHASMVGVDWGGFGIVTSQQSLNLPDGTDYSSTRVWSRTGSEPLTPTSNYSAQPLNGFLQYNTSAVAANLTNAVIQNRTDGNGDRFYVKGHDNAGTTAQSVAGLVYVEKQHFMNGLSDASVQFDADSTMSVSITNLVAGGSGTVRLVRMAVLNEGQWYVSQSLSSIVTTFTISNLLDQQWAAYPVTTPLTEPFGLDYNVAGSEFKNIEAVGIYFLNRNPGSATARDFSFDRFSVSLAPIPEPSSVVLLGAAAICGGALLRRRKSAL